MKKNIIITAIIFIFSMSLVAQEKINISIEKVIKGEYTYIKMTITNNNDFPIVIPHLASVRDLGVESGSTPSYIKANVYDINGRTLNNKSRKRSFHQTDRWKTAIPIRSGDSFERIDLLFQLKEIYGLVSSDLKDKAKTIEIEVHLEYIPMYPDVREDNHKIVKDFKSNRINL